MAECYLRTSVAQTPQTVSAESVLRSAATCFPLPWSTCVHLLSVNNENPPVGLILCARKDEVVARYALEGVPNKVMAAEIRRTQEVLEERKRIAPTSRGETGMKQIVKKKQETRERTGSHD